MRCAMPCAVRCEWAQCSEREGNTSWAVRLAGRGCVSDTRPPGVTCNVTDTSDRWRPAALEIVWGHAVLGWACECPRIHVSNMRIAHGWGTQRAAVASRHCGGALGLAAGQETRGTAAADAHGVAGDGAGPNRGRPSRRARLRYWEARSTDVYLLQASGSAEGEAAADVTEVSTSPAEWNAVFSFSSTGGTTDTDPSLPARARGRTPCAAAVPSSMQRAVLSRTANPSLAGV